MSSLRSMLVDEFINEFNELNNFFAKEFLSNNAMGIDLDYFSNYTLDKINNLFGRRKQIFKNDSELLNALRLVINDGYCTALINKKRPLFYIPIFLYLLKNNPVDNLEFQELCMKIHLTKNKKSLFSLDGLKKLDVPFRARIADTLEMVLLANDFSTDLRTVLNLLDYIDYERFINGERDSELDRNMCPTPKSAEAHLALIQLEQLRDCYRGLFVTVIGMPVWCIIRHNGRLVISPRTWGMNETFLSFQSKEVAEEYLKNFKPLIEKAGDLI